MTGLSTTTTICLSLETEIKVLFYNIWALRTSADMISKSIWNQIEKSHLDFGSKLKVIVKPDDKTSGYLPL